MVITELTELATGDTGGPGGNSASLSVELSELSIDAPSGPLLSAHQNHSFTYSGKRKKVTYYQCFNDEWTVLLSIFTQNITYLLEWILF